MDIEVYGPIGVFFCSFLTAGNESLQCMYIIYIYIYILQSYSTKDIDGIKFKDIRRRALLNYDIFTYLMLQIYNFYKFNICYNISNIFLMFRHRETGALINYTVVHN